MHQKLMLSLKIVLTQGAPAIALFAKVKELSDQIKAGERVADIPNEVEVDVHEWLISNNESIHTDDI